MNYCILNGLKSSYIKGLLIQSLPSITKPLMRTSIEEIDGRDGDIVTKLGYSAYDKEMSIGLFGDYNIDEVIQFFASEGAVIFSNEPDKFYNYQIINQIDFEKLIKFKTATVTFHVQPFKHSAVDGVAKFDPNMISIPNWKKTTNGITVAVENGIIKVSGTTSTETEFYVPVNPLTLNAGTHTLDAITDGTGESFCSIRLIGEIPSNNDSFSNSYLQLKNDGKASMTATLNASKTFNFIWLKITAGIMNFSVETSIMDTLTKSLTVINNGNTISKPRITVYGNGVVYLSINDQQVLSINIGDAEYIAIDAQKMNAYHDNTFMNRSVVGNYEKLVLKAGANTISWTGNITKITVENYSRWL